MFIMLTMKVLDFSEVNHNFPSVLEQIVNEQSCTIISRKNSEDAVIMSKRYYDSLMETIYLLKSPTNAKHLEEAIAEYQAGKTQEHNLIGASELCYK